MIGYLSPVGLMKAIGISSDRTAAQRLAPLPSEAGMGFWMAGEPNGLRLGCDVPVQLMKDIGAAVVQLR